MKFWWEKNKGDVNWLPTLKMHSPFEICGIWNSWKLKIYWIEFEDFKSLLPHVNGVTSKAKFYFMIQEKKFKNKKYIFMQFETRIFFKTKHRIWWKLYTLRKFLVIHQILIKKNFM
jgi:hypothetical protein